MSLYGAYISGFFPVDYHTEAANTAIDEAIQGQNGKRLALIGFEYLAAATAHTASFMYPGTSTGSRNTTSAAAASAQKVINVTNSPLDPAGNAADASDIVAYQCIDGSWEFNTIASVSTKAITHSTNLAKAVASGARYVIFGVVGDLSCYNIICTASTTIKHDGYISIVAPYKGDPMYVSITNATNAGVLHRALFAYINK